MLKRTVRLFVMPAATAILLTALLTAVSLTLAQEEPVTEETTVTEEAVPATSAAAPVESGYASANGLEMYYEIYGEGEPIVMLHGAYMSIVSMGEIIPLLAESRQVIAVELQGHGRTADIDRPIRYEAMADDVAALLDTIDVPQADVFGYSMGGGVAVQLAIRHPEKVDRLVVASMTYSSTGYYPEMLAMIETITPEVFAGSPMEAAYTSLAPNPQDFATLVTKLTELDAQPFDWEADFGKITAPTLLIFGDSDLAQLDHITAMFKALGGGVFGDLAGLPASQLAVLPGTMHVTVLSQANWLNEIITRFLDEQPVQASF